MWHVEVRDLECELCGLKPAVYHTGEKRQIQCCVCMGVECIQRFDWEESDGNAFVKFLGPWRWVCLRNADGR